MKCLGKLVTVKLSFLMYFIVNIRNMSEQTPGDSEGQGWGCK